MKNGTRELNCDLRECLTMAEAQPTNLNVGGLEEQLRRIKLKCLDLAELQHNDVEKLINVLRQKTSYYEQENIKLESFFQRLQLMDDQLKIFEECDAISDKLVQLQQQFEVKEVTPTAIALSHADKLRKHSKYAAKMKGCIKTYIELNETLAKKIKHLKSNREQAEKKISRIMTTTQDEVKANEKKISKYEQELSKLEKKYPWLTNSDLDLPNISKEINMLRTIRNNKEELVKELSSYHDLKPDLQEASEQLSQIKVEYEEFNRKLLEK